MKGLTSDVVVHVLDEIEAGWNTDRSVVDDLNLRGIQRVSYRRSSQDCCVTTPESACRSSCLSKMLSCPIRPAHQG